MGLHGLSQGDSFYFYVFLHKNIVFELTQRFRQTNKQIHLHLQSRGYNVLALIWQVHTGSGCSGQEAKYVALLRSLLTAETVSKQFHISRAEKRVTSKRDFSTDNRAASFWLQKQGF
jgi:hypothetical protein